MRHSQLDKELSLLLMLTEGKAYTVQQLCDRIDVSRRSLYYYLEFLKDYGFIVERHGTSYSIDRNSPFFTRLLRTVHFTEDEAVVMRRLLERVDDHSIQVRHLKQKLDRYYDLGILDDVAEHKQEANNIEMLYEAIKLNRQVIIHSYSSSNSKKQSDRIVEPFLFLGNNNEVRCYEPTTKQNKTFKVSRMGSVELLADEWQYEKEHKVVYTDLFGFNGETRFPVRMRLDRTAYNLLTEEYPAALSSLTPDGQYHWLLSTEVCNYLGIGRFVMGLFENIEIIEGDGLKAFLREKLKGMMDSLVH